MLKILTLTVMMMIAPAVAFGQVLVISGGSYYLLSLDNSGRPVLTPFAQVVNLGAPIPNPTPTPTPTSSLREKARTLALATGDATGRAALSAVYSIVADKVASGEISVDRSFAATTQATDAVLGSLGTTAKWTAWREAMGSELTAMKIAGKLSTKAEHVQAFKEISLGLDDASRSSRLFENIDWIQLFKLIQLIIELLSKFI